MTNLQAGIAEFERFFAQHPPDSEELIETDNVGECLGTLFLMVKEGALARRRLTPGTAQQIERVIARWSHEGHPTRQAVLGFVEYLAGREQADRDLQELVG
jgi:hypothetical protein